MTKVKLIYFDEMNANSKQKWMENEWNDANKSNFISQISCGAVLFDSLYTKHFMNIYICIQHLYTIAIAIAVNGKNEIKRNGIASFNELDANDGTPASNKRIIETTTAMMGPQQKRHEIIARKMLCLCGRTIVFCYNY